MTSGLEPGALLGHYRILRLLGRGGMGEVYLAEDTLLPRKVALKLLSSVSTADPHRLERFTQEAHASSALNHPNIITIYEVGDEQGTRFIATEYIEGKTLRQIMLDGRLGLHDALDIAAQAASGLAAAHGAGIVHRDIKPENIIIRPDGFLKILDFGLAKLTEPSTPAQDDATISMGAVHTGTGIVMGTVRYMSPEQARGAPVDARTDIFSLGVVLYEMITGHAPFEGDTPSHQIVAILERDPPPAAQYAPETPAEMDRITRKALTKNRDERYQTAKDFAVDLRQLRRRMDVETEVQRLSPSGGYALPSTATSVGRRKWTAKRFAIAGVLLLLLLGAALMFGIWRARSAIPFQNVTPTQLTDTGKARAAVISPDGRYVLYTLTDAGSQSLNIRQVSTGSTVQIQPPVQGAYGGLSFSPDGEFVYFIRAERGTIQTALYKLPTLGGSPTKLLDNINSAVSFSPSGKEFAFFRLNIQARGTDLYIASAAGAGERKVKSVTAPKGTTTSPVWSPDGKVIAMGMLNPDPAGYYATVVAVPAHGGAEQVVGSFRWGVIVSSAWLPDGRGLVLVATERGNNNSSKIWYQPYPSGEPRKLTNDLNIYTSISVTSDSKALLTVKRDIISSLWIQDLDNPASLREITPAGGRYDGVFGLNWTPSGKLVYVSKSAGGTDLFIRDPDKPESEQLTTDQASAAFAHSTRDGKLVYFCSNRGGSSMHIWRYGLEDRSLKQITDGRGELVGAVSPDGKWLVFSGVDRPGLWKMPTDGGTPVQLTSKTESGPSISPDGQWIAYSFVDQAAGGRVRFAFMPSAGGPPTRIFDYAIPSAGDGEWSADGKAITYDASQGGTAQIWSQPIDGSPPKQLLTYPRNSVFSYAWSDDGKKLAVSKGNSNSDVVLLK